MKEVQILYSETAEEIREMARIDQEAVKDPEEWKKFKKIRQIKYTNRIKEIITKIGWPTISKVGKDASYKTWLLVQHSDQDISFQEECLRILKEQDENDIDKTNIAYLEDRVRINQVKPQLYGTQWQYPGGVMTLFPLEDPEGVEKRRKEMGLETIEESKRVLRQWSKEATLQRDKKKS